LRRISSPAPAPLVFELDVGDGGTLGALGVRSGGNVWGVERNSDSRVDASDIDTDISSRLMYNIYSYSYLLVCLSDAGSSSLAAACSTSLSIAGMQACGSSLALFSFSWTNKILVLLFIYSFGNCGRGRPALPVFPRAFRARGFGGNASPSSSDEPVSADLRIWIRRCQFGCWRGVLTLRSSVPFFLDEPFALVSLAGFRQLCFGGRELAASILHRHPEALTGGFVSFALFALGSWDTLLEALLHPVPLGGMRGHVISFVA